MAQSWACPAGHSGSGRLPLPTCPVCGLPVDYSAAKQAVPQPEEALVRKASPRPSPAGAGDVRDLVFLEGQSTSPGEATQGHTLNPLDRPSFAPRDEESELKSVDPPSRPAPPSSRSTSVGLSWMLQSAPLSQDDTMQRPGDSTPPSDAVAPSPSQAGPTEIEATQLPPGQPYDTMVRPTAPATSTPHGGEPASAAMPVGYEILGVLGRGGMGVVYKAKQRGLNRIVALKMILHGSHATAEDLMRFKIEAESVAKLRHPNVVQIYDVGEREGKPFFSLEYLEGGSLQGRLKGEPMTPRGAAALVETLARAMDHAHRHGIVHRDLKPANVLLAEPAGTPLEKCTPKITDFGLAKRLEAEDQGQTNTEAILGTPTYMAPEQASNSKSVGPAADLYALGAILYDLLTGRPPFKGTTVLDTLQMVQQAEPVAPVALNSKIPGDLQTICLKCLEKEPAKRYKSAETLAEDLRAFLDGRPIKARPVGMVERGWKWAKRNPARAALVALSVLSLLIITAGSATAAVIFYHLNKELEKTVLQKEAARKDADDSAKKEAKAREDAQRNEQEAKAAERKALAALDRAERAEGDAQESFLRAQEGSDEVIAFVQEWLRNEPGTEQLRKTLLSKGVKMWERFTDRPSNNPASRLRAAKAYRGMGELQARLGEVKAAEASFRAALDLYAGLINDKDKSEKPLADYENESIQIKNLLWSLLLNPNPKKAGMILDGIRDQLAGLPPDKAGQDVHLLNRAMLLCNQGVQNQRIGERAAAEKFYALAESELKRLDGRSRSSLELARLDVNRSALLYEAGASGQKNAKGLQKAAELAQRAIVRLLTLLESKRVDLDAASELARAYGNLGLIYLAQGKPKEAAKADDEAVEHLERLGKLFPLYVDFKHLLAVALTNQGFNLLKAEQIDLALRPLERGRKLLEELVKGYADVPEYRHDLAKACATQGVYYLRAKLPGRAIDLLRKAEGLLEEQAKQSPGDEAPKRELEAIEQNLESGHNQLARDAFGRKDWAKALAHVEDLALLFEKRIERLRPLPEGATPLEKLERAGEALLARADLVGTLRSLARLQEQLRDHQGVAATVARLRKYLPPNSPGWIEAAAMLCHCIQHAEKDDKLQEAERARAVGQYGKAALSLLEGLAAAKSPDLAEALDGPDFEPLRKLSAFRDDYRRLVEKVKKP